MKIEDLRFIGLRNISYLMIAPITSKGGIAYWQRLLSKSKEKYS